MEEWKMEIAIEDRGKTIWREEEIEKEDYLEDKEKLGRFLEELKEIGFVKVVELEGIKEGEAKRVEAIGELEELEKVIDCVDSYNGMYKVYWGDYTKPRK